MVYQGIQSITQSTGYFMHYIFLFCLIPFQHLKHTKGLQNNTLTSPAFALSEHSICFFANYLSSQVPKLTNHIFQVYATYAVIAGGGHRDPLTSTSHPMLEYVLKRVKCQQAKAGICFRKFEMLGFLNFCEPQNSPLHCGKKLIRDLISQSQTWPCMHA